MYNLLNRKSVSSQVQIITAEVYNSCFKENLLPGIVRICNIFLGDAITSYN